MGFAKGMRLMLRRTGIPAALLTVVQHAGIELVSGCSYWW